MINQLRESGVGKREAIIEAAKARLRPIVMTTLTTALGLTPLAIGIGEGAEIRVPMAITSPQKRSMKTPWSRCWGRPSPIGLRSGPIRVAR